MPNGREVVEDMAGAGWARIGDVEFAVELERGVTRGRRSPPR